MGKINIYHLNEISNTIYDMSKAIDVSNRKFGRLLATEPVYVEDKYSKIVRKWKCICDCGKEKVVSVGFLLDETVRSCGCLYRDTRKDLANRARLRNSKPAEVASFNRLYADYKGRADSKKLAFSLSEEEFRKIAKQDCKYCGVAPLQKGNKVAAKNGAFLHNGIDRIDNNIGYIYENCVACCSMCNDAKNSYTLEQFREWIQRLISHQRIDNESRIKMDNTKC